MSSMPPTDQKSKKKKKPKKKGANTAESTHDANATSPTDSQQGAGEAAVAAAPAEVDVGTDSEESDHEDANAILPEKSKDHASGQPNGVASQSTDGSDPAARFDALVKDRDALREEVTRLRQSLEDLQAKHEREVEEVQAELQETQGEKENAEEQYQSLLGKVNTIRSQLGERLKADAEELAHCRTRIDELEEHKSELQDRCASRSAEVETLTARNNDLTEKSQEQSKELSTLRNRLTLSQQNWLKEKEELVESEVYMREEFENAKQAMHDWEVLAMEERTQRRDLHDRNADLEEQVSSLRDALEKASNERDTQASAVEGLQKALQEIQTLRKTELKELVESSQSEQEALRKQLSDLQSTHSSTVSDLESVKKDLERALPFEKEVKEKNLLIGKLRHEAVILSDHLTKALRFLKKGKPEDNVDRQIVTNHLLHFLALDRSDPKKFQILQLIAALLGWTDAQREQAGLSRPGTNTSSASTLAGSLRLPGSPLVHRTPSTPALGGGEYFGTSTESPASKESLAELWQSFLEQEASNGGPGTGTGKQRTTSQGTIPPTLK